MEFTQQIEDLKARYNGDLSNIDKKFIQLNYERVTGKTFNKRGCNQCYKDAIIEMYIMYKKNGFMKENKYILKRGKVLHYKGEVYTRQNITDEIAANYLEDFPSQSDLFEAIPETEAETVTVKRNVTKKNAEKKKSETKEIIEEITEPKDAEL